MFDRILVPLDGSPLAESILPRLRPLLRRRDAEVILTQVVSLPASAEGEIGSVIDLMERQAQNYLAELDRRLSSEGILVRHVMRVGLAAETILDLARREGVDLIAMTTHGRTGLPRWVFGSVTEKVLRASPVPLLLSRSFPPPERPLKKILVPIEAGEASMAVLPAAEEMARLFNAHVILLHVCREDCAAVPVPELTRAFEQVRDAGVWVEPMIRMGEPAQMILETCREQSVDLIAMTTHGRTGVSRWVFGSVTEKVLRASPLPLLVVRAGHAPSGESIAHAGKGEAVAENPR